MPPPPPYSHSARQYTSQWYTPCMPPRASSPAGMCTCAGYGSCGCGMLGSSPHARREPAPPPPHTCMAYPHSRQHIRPAFPFLLPPRREGALLRQLHLALQLPARGHSCLLASSRLPSSSTCWCWGQPSRQGDRQYTQVKAAAVPSRTGSSAAAARAANAPQQQAPACAAAVAGALEQPWDLASHIHCKARARSSPEPGAHLHPLPAPQLKMRIRPLAASHLDSSLCLRTRVATWP